MCVPARRRCAIQNENPILRSIGKNKRSKHTRKANQANNTIQAEDGIRDSVASRGLGDVYKRQPMGDVRPVPGDGEAASLLGTSPEQPNRSIPSGRREPEASGCLRFPPYGRRLCGV